MKSILLIGLGRFGRHIAQELNELGHQVMAIDSNEDRVNAVLSYVTNALLSLGFPQDLAPCAHAQVVGLHRACPLSRS